jgi:hypothetical protein
MEIYSLNNLTNKYPSGSILNPSASVSDAYTTSNDINGNSIIEFQGAFIDNIKTFNITLDSIDLNSIIAVDDTTIKFIIEFRESEDVPDSTPSYYTSAVYYNELLSASLESNPYYSTQILDNQISRIVVPYGSYVQNIRNNIQSELNKGIVFSRKHAFIINGETVSVDFEFFTKYIDWVVKSPSNATTYFPLDELYEYEINENNLIKIKSPSDIAPTEEQIIQNSIQKIIQNSIDSKVIDLQRTITQLQLQIQNLSNQ